MAPASSGAFGVGFGVALGVALGRFQVVDLAGSWKGHGVKAQECILVSCCSSAG